MSYHAHLQAQSWTIINYTQVRHNNNNNNCKHCSTTATSQLQQRHNYNQKSTNQQPQATNLRAQTPKWTARATLRSATTLEGRTAPRLPPVRRGERGGRGVYDRQQTPRKRCETHPLQHFLPPPRHLIISPSDNEPACSSVSSTRTLR